MIALGRRASGRAAAVLAWLLIAGAGCTDGPDAAVRPQAEELATVSPVAQSDQRPELTTFLWKPTAQGAEFQAAYRSAANGSGNGLAFRPIQPSIPEVAALRQGVERRSPVFHPSWSLLNAEVERGGAPPLRRLSLRGRTIERVLPDGRRMSLQMGLHGPNGEPPTDLLVQIDGRTVSLHQYTYQKRGGRWEATESLMTTFDEDGRPALVLQQKIRGGQVVSDERLDGPAPSSVRAPGGVRPPVVPPDAIAAVVGDCLVEQLNLAAASLDLSLALSALSYAVAACFLSGGWACPAIVAALAWVAVAAMNELAAMLQLNQCLLESRTGEGGTADPYEYRCTTYFVEVSHDDGRTWELVHIIIIC